MDYPTTHQTECNVTPSGPRGMCVPPNGNEITTWEMAVQTTPVRSDMRELILAWRVSFSRPLGERSSTKVRILSS